MKCTVIHTFGREDLYTEIIDADPIHDEDFCDHCGDCLKCYGEDKCVNGGDHFFVRYVQHEEEELGPMIRKLRAELAQSRQQTNTLASTILSLLNHHDMVVRSMAAIADPEMDEYQQDAHKVRLNASQDLIWNIKKTYLRTYGDSDDLSPERRQYTADELAEPERQLREFRVREFRAKGQED